LQKTDRNDKDLYDQQKAIDYLNFHPNIPKGNGIYFKKGGY